MKSNDLPLVSFRLDGREVQALQGESILQAAARNGVDIPHLCHKEGMRPDGNCRACVVEIAGERVLAPSCCRAVTPGMEVQATSERARKSQKMVVDCCWRTCRNAASSGPMRTARPASTASSRTGPRAWA